jgi:hypothetical protein
MNKLKNEELLELFIVEDKDVEVGEMSPLSPIINTVPPRSPRNDNNNISIYEILNEMLGLFWNKILSRVLCF